MKIRATFLLILALVLAACAPAELPPTVASALSTQAATAIVAVTEVAATAHLINPTPTQVVASGQSGTAAAATSSGPVVITVMPANGSPQPNVTPAPLPTATPIPTLSSGLSPTELKYQVLSMFPNVFFCDPDFYPVARGDEAALAEQRFPEIQANHEEYQAIVKHNGLANSASLNAEQMLLVYREHKKLAAVRFEKTGDKYQFQLQTKDANGKGFLITGLIDGTGTVSAQQSQPSVATCPICLAAQTQIDTPRGPVAVIDLRPGDRVWTVDGSGARVSAVILRTGHMPVPATHQMVHVVLADGRELWASPGHPTADGRTLGALAAGERLDGARIVSAERVVYGQPATYDLLPAGATGFYWANGILVGSTLK